LHRDFVKNFKYAKVWGNSVKFPGQKVGLEHKLEDHDIVRIIIKKWKIQIKKKLSEFNVFLLEVWGLYILNFDHII